MVWVLSNRYDQSSPWFQSLSLWARANKHTIFETFLSDLFYEENFSFLWEFRAWQYRPRCPNGLNPSGIPRPTKTPPNFTFTTASRGPRSHLCLKTEIRFATNYLILKLFQIFRIQSLTTIVQASFTFYCNMILITQSISCPTYCTLSCPGDLVQLWADGLWRGTHGSCQELPHLWHSEKVSTFGILFYFLGISVMLSTN